MKSNKVPDDVVLLKRIPDDELGLIDKALRDSFNDKNARVYAMLYRGEQVTVAMNNDDFTLGFIIKKCFLHYCADYGYKPFEVNKDVNPCYQNSNGDEKYRIKNINLVKA